MVGTMNTKTLCHSECSTAKRLSRRNAMKTGRIYSLKFRAKIVKIHLPQASRFFTAFRMTMCLKIKEYCNSESSAAKRRIYSFITSFQSVILLFTTINRFFTELILSETNVFRMTSLAKSKKVCHSERSVAQRRIYHLKEATI